MATRMDVRLGVRSASRSSAFPIFRLAWRNLWRHRVRTVLLVLVVAYATLATLAFWGFNEGYAVTVSNVHARFMTAPVRVAREAWFEDPDPENALESLTLEKRLLGLAGVGAVAARLEFPALLRSAYRSEGVQARGVDPQAEPRVSHVPQKVRQGRWLASPGEVVLGFKLAEVMDARIGERVVLDASSLGGPQARGLVVVGLVHAGVPFVDQGGVFVALDDARALTGVETATTLDLDVPLGQEVGAARTAQILLPPGISARGVWDLMGPVRTDIEAGLIMAVPVGLLLALLAGIAVTSTVLVSVIERTREFGVIAALGLEPRALARMVALESVLATALGWLFGLVLGYALMAYLATHNVLGPIFASYGEANVSTGIGEEFYTAVRPIYALYSAATIVLAGLLAVLIPGRRVRRLEPVAAMRAD